MTDGGLWAFLRKVLVVGGHMERQYAESGYESLSAAIDVKASSLTDELRELMGVPVEDEVEGDSFKAAE